MRIFLDTNILISAALYPKGKAATAFFRAAGAPNADILITGDDDLLRVADQINHPKIMRISEFLDI